MSQKIDLKVEYTNRMAQEYDALRAQIEQFREFAELIVEWKEYGFEKAKTLLDSTPEQCLAEIKAQAFKKGFEACINAAVKMGMIDADGEFSNQLRQQAKRGDL